MENLLGALTIMKQLEIKPNFSLMERKYGVNRNTIRKYYTQGGKKRKERAPSISKYDKYRDEIEYLLSKQGVTKMAAFMFLTHKYEDFNGKYSGFKSYTASKGIKANCKIEPHPRFETPKGDQLQVDWKESLTLHTKRGDEIKFNVFCAKLGNSRLNTFIYSESLTTEDFIRCSIDTFNRLGGLPKHILTDNMSAIVSIRNGKKYKHNIIKSFEKDMGVKIKLCKVKSPETKGKIESSNRFVSRIKAYDYEFDTKEELINIVKDIERDSNLQINKTTKMPPIVLFEKEKEYLKPIPNKLLLESYIDNTIVSIVPPTMLVVYQGNGYSVDPKYINKRVKIHPIDNKLYIYYQKDLIATHNICSAPFNYTKEHLVEAYKFKYKSDSEKVEMMAEENLNSFKYL